MIKAFALGGHVYIYDNETAQKTGSDQRTSRI